MKKIFLTTWALVLSACILMFLAVHIKPLGRTLMYERKVNGMSAAGLYFDCKVDYFKEYYRGVDSQEKTSLQEADIIAFGDSFFNSGLGDLWFADLLEQQTGRPVHGVDNRYEEPLGYLKKNNYQKGKEKILIFENVEYISVDQPEKHKRYVRVPKNIWDKVVNGVQWRLMTANEWLKARVVTMHNKSKDFRYFFFNNRVVFPVARWIANFRFNYLGEIDPIIGAYSTDPAPRMVFYAPSVKFNRRAKTPEEVQGLVDYVSGLSHELKRRYNIRMIYAVIPNRYTIYHDFVNKEYTYDGYIPTLYGRLKERGIEVIDVYSMFTQYRAGDDSRLLYHRADTHWNPFGKRMFVGAVVKKIAMLPPEETKNAPNVTE